MPMNHPEFSLSGLRPFRVLLLGALPVLWAGFHLGAFASGLGTDGEPRTIVVRALICAVPAVGLALAAPRCWWLLTIFHGYGFHAGHTFGDAMGAALGTLLAAPFAALTGNRIGLTSDPAHPDLLWIYLFTLWLTAFISFLRRNTRERMATKSNAAI